ncbi:rac GTPase-activating protein 1-like isoform X2 [Eublepharis macularius]|uniref:Rac GTPase-activating protein 1-like isoform X2 n=1 Tax=Eublepharis macularius TaxID=481883 RepID=A0AA97IWF2_EUBMA|nr:rac GTPase-activating protein 1-like isoform X2 [Eublepharis macularius]
MSRLGIPLMHRMDQLLQLIEFNSSIELDYLQIARCLEGMRQRCCRLDHDLRGARDRLRHSESERSVLEVKLKHARNQVEVEMKKRHRAEAELEKQERKLQLIYDYLMADSQINPLKEDQRSALAAFDGRCFGRSTLLPGKQMSAVEELGTSILSDISFDHSDDEVDLEMIKPAKGSRRRSSLAPLIQPVIAAKRARPSVTPTPNVQELALSLRSEGTAESQSLARNLLPIGVAPRRRSHQSRHISTITEFTTVRGSSDESGGCSSQGDSHAISTEIRAEGKGAQGCFSSTPSPPRGAPPHQQHHFTSKTIIRLETCSACKSRLRFGKVALKCRPCQLVVHPECKEHCPSLCMPGARPRVREGVLADFAPSTPPMVPQLVVQCVTQVESRGLQEMGLYRISGAEPIVREWKNKLLRSRGAVPSLDQVADVHVICGILKDFLRSLKEPLLTFYLHSAFLHAADIQAETARRTALCHVVMKLPLANRDTLAFLILHLHRVIQSPECRMDQHSLARIFGPTLVGHSVPNPTPVTIMEDTPRQSQVVSQLLALPLTFWKCFVREEQENLVPSEQLPGVVNEQERLFHLRPPSEINSIQLSPATGSGCLPSKLRDCIGTTFLPMHVSRTKKTGKFFPLPT